jgi:hypothetical protein
MGVMGAYGEYDPARASLRGPQLRLERAKEHLETLEKEWRSYFQREPYRISQPERDGEWSVIRLEEIREWPDLRWGVVTSEFVHHLRAALDNLVWQLVLLNGRKTPGEDTQFPIFLWKNPRQLNKMLNGVRWRDHRAFIEKIQPYKRRDKRSEQFFVLRFVLTRLRAISNTDKHRFLNPLIAVRQGGTQIHTVVANRPGDPVEVLITTGALYEGAELVRWRNPEWPNTNVGVAGKTPVDITLGDLSTTLSVLKTLYSGVAEIVERFKSDFP